MLKLLFAAITLLFSFSAFAALELPLDSLPSWVTYVVAGAYALSHLIAILPESAQAKLPSWLLSLINLFAANYGSAKNKADPKWRNPY